MLAWDAQRVTPLTAHKATLRGAKGIDGDRGQEGRGPVSYGQREGSVCRLMGLTESRCKS